MEREEWPLWFIFYRRDDGFCVEDQDGVFLGEAIIGPLAIRNAYIIAGTHAASIAAGKE